MNRNLQIIAAIAMVLLPWLPVHAQDSPEEKHWIDVKMQQAIDKDGSTSGMIAATNDALKDWDKELNKHYQKLINSFDDNAKTKL